MCKKTLSLLRGNMSFTLVLSGSSNVLSADFNPPIYLDNGEYVIGLTNFETFNAIPNIDWRNNKFTYGNLTLTIPSGAYELEDINKYLQNELKSTDSTFRVLSNNNTLHTIIENEKPVHFYEGSIGKILGFKNGILEAGKHVSDYPAEIIKVNAICIDCSIATGSYYNGKPVHIVHTFFPRVGPGFKIIESPQNIIYFPVNVKIVNNVTVQILDQDGELVNFSGETVTVRLHVKKISENGSQIQ